MSFFPEVSFVILLLGGFMTKVVWMVPGYKGKKKKLVFPEKIKGKKVTKIGSEALRGNKYVTSVDIPDTVKTVEWNSFYECSKLATIKLGKKCKSVWRRL